MTKTVRIENADTNNDKRLIVDVWEKGPDGYYAYQRTLDLAYPTALLTETLWDGKELRIREANHVTT